MGNWYANIALRGPSQADTLAALRAWRRTAFVSPSQMGYIVVYDLECSKMDSDDSERLAAKLSSRFSCPALIMLNADDDALWLCLYDRGERSVEYDSSSVSRAGARAFARAFDRPLLGPILWVVFQMPFVFQVWRHMVLCRLLRLPAHLCIHAYGDIDLGDLLPGFVPDMFQGTRES